MILALAGAAVMGGMIAVAGVVSVLAVRSALQRRWKRRACVAAATASSIDPASSALQSRMDVTRQRLWWTLLRDSNLMLNNRLKVRHLMTRDLLIVSPTKTVDEMSRLMEESKVRHLLVCDDDGRLLGIVSNRDLNGHRLETARQVMTSPPHTVSRDTSLTTAITCLINKHISCLPVVDHDRPCGVITTTDLVLTLQCTLQLWLRVAQAVQSDPEWLETVQRIDTVIDDDLADQQTHLAKLVYQIMELDAVDKDQAWHRLAKQAGEVLEVSTHLAHEIANAHHRIREHTHRLVNLIDLRNDSSTGESDRRDLPGTLEMMPTVRRGRWQPFSLVVIAVDDVRTVRDEYGAMLATDMLRAVADLIVDNIHATDFVARCEDDTFVVLLPQTDLEGASALCARLRKAAEQSFQFAVPLRISTGVVSALGDENSSTLLARAEAALSTCQSTQGNGAPSPAEDDGQLSGHEASAVG